MPKVYYDKKLRFHGVEVPMGVLRAVEVVSLKRCLVPMEQSSHRLEGVNNRLRQRSQPRSELLEESGD